jgi:hypothetical protein
MSSQTCGIPDLAGGNITHLEALAAFEAMSSQTCGISDLAGGNITHLEALAAFEVTSSQTCGRPDLAGGNITHLEALAAFEAMSSQTCGMLDLAGGNITVIKHHAACRAWRKPKSWPRHRPDSFPLAGLNFSFQVSSIGFRHNNVQYKYLEVSAFGALIIRHPFSPWYQ